MKRVGAALAVVVMLVAAFVVRGGFGGDSGGSFGEGFGGGDAGGDGILCVAAFESICADAGVVVADVRPAGATLETLLAATSADALAAQAWIVPAAWAEVVLAERSRLGRSPLFAIDETVLASSPVVVAIWSDRRSELATACGTVDWRCLADREGSGLSSGDRVRIGAPDVDDAIGLPVAAAQTSSLLGRSDYAANDFDAAFSSSARRLAAGQIDDPLLRMRSRGPGELTAVGVTAADAMTLSSNFGTIEVVESDPRLRVDVVALVPRGRDLPGTIGQALTRSFQAAGWGAPASSRADAGLPAGGVLAAVRTVWNET